MLKTTDLTSCYMSLGSLSQDKLTARKGNRYNEREINGENAKTIKIVLHYPLAAHLSVTGIERLTRYKQAVLAALLKGKSMPSNMAANTIHTTLLTNQSAIKYIP